MYVFALLSDISSRQNSRRQLRMSNELCQVSSDIFQTRVSECRNNRYKQPIKMVAGRSSSSSTFYQCNKIRRGICTNAGIADNGDLAWENVSFQNITEHKKHLQEDKIQLRFRSNLSLVDIWPDSEFPPLGVTVPYCYPTHDIWSPASRETLSIIYHSFEPGWADMGIVIHDTLLPQLASPGCSRDNRLMDCLRDWSVRHTWPSSGRGMRGVWCG